MKELIWKLGIYKTSKFNNFPDVVIEDLGRPYV